MKEDKVIKTNGLCASCGHIVTPENGVMRHFGSEEQLATIYERTGYFIVHRDGCPDEKIEHEHVFWFTPGWWHVGIRDKKGLIAEIASGGTPGGSKRTEPLPARVKQNILGKYPDAVEL